MAGRGCVIHIQVIRSSSGEENSETISLPVALHTTLQILRMEIERLTNISMADQVLILCDFTDVERNSDVHLIGRDHLSLRECGIRNNSTLTVHALGISAENNMTNISSSPSMKRARYEEETPIKTLSTRITPARANHSYNGVIFDIESKGPSSVIINSISLGGMLGTVVCT
jgi:hypothetical protein